MEETLLEIAATFHGLCLDCMDRSKPKTGDVDRDYWTHDFKDEWDVNCRIQHGQSTWYFSFMGRKSEMKAHQLQKQKMQQEQKNYERSYGLGSHSFHHLKSLIQRE